MPTSCKFVLLVPALLLAGIGAAPASAGPAHLHCMTNASGNTHAIAQGVTLHAPHEPALHNFHQHVHTGAFGGTNPHTVTADTTAPFSC